MRRLEDHTATRDLLKEQIVPQYLQESKLASIMALPGGKASEYCHPDAEGYVVLGPGDCISCQAVSRLYP